MQNLLGRLALLCDSKDDVLRFIDKIIAEEKRYGYGVEPPGRENSSRAPAGSPPAAFPELPTLKEAEKEVIRQALEACGHNISSAARVLGISRTTLYRKMNDLRLGGSC
jgi:transcriptional regulator of acetoin/glycerol metabolism